MRIRKRKNLAKKNAAIVGLFLIPLIGFGIYVGALLYILNDVAAFTYHMPPPDTKYFYELGKINEETLEKLAQTYESQLRKQHAPANIPVDVTFKDRTYREIDYWHGTDNGALHLGYALAAECFRYKTALDEGKSLELIRATNMIKKFVTGFSDMMAAPNGGIGPNYSGTPARFVCSPENRKYHPFLFEEHPRHFNGTGKYKDWRVRLHTSRDELAGYDLGLACVLKFVDPEKSADSKWCVDRIKLLTEQMIEGFKKTNWLVLGGEGEPVGSDLNPYLEGSTWQLALLRIGATANPEKYESLYQYVASKALSMNSANMGGVWNTVEDTYALAFGMDVMFALIMLEDNPLLRNHYIKNFETGFYDYLRRHRNAYYNIIHLVFMTLVDDPSLFEDPNYNDDTIRWDVLDQLWRFQVSGWNKGIRNYNIWDRPHSTRWSSLNPEIRKMKLNPSKARWREFFENDVNGALFSWISDEFHFDRDMYQLPLTVSEYGVHYFLWEHSKFYGEGGDPRGNGLKQAVPTSYLTIYWMARAFDVI